jgi:hypothetical protein
MESKVACASYPLLAAALVRRQYFTCRLASWRTSEHGARSDFWHFLSADSRARVSWPSIESALAWICAGDNEARVAWNSWSFSKVPVSRRCW